MDTWLQDLKFGLRVLFKSPAFTAVAVIALALGIGANTAIFSVVNAVLLTPLPYEDPDRLVMVWERNQTLATDRNVISPANFLDWQEQNSVFDQMAAMADSTVNLSDVDEPEELPIQYVSPNYFSMMRTAPFAGRLFTKEDGEPGSERVVILSHGLWQRRFGADPSIVGKTIKLNGIDFTVAGVASPDHRLYIKEMSFTSKEPELWTPLRFTPNNRIRRGRSMRAIARIKPGIALEQAQAEMSAIAGRLEQQYPDFNKNWEVNLVPLTTQMTGEIRPALLVLLGAVGFVLLIACANVANLLLARAASRNKEIALRSALGASRLRIVRQLLTESIVLAAVGGALGLLLALWGVDVLLSLTPQDLLGVKKIGLDFRVLGFTFGVSLLTGLVFGLAPALSASRPNLNEALKEGGKGAASGTHRLGARNIFVVVEVALALILLVGAGLMIKSFLRLQSVDPGFDSKNLLTARMVLPGSKYREDHQRVAFFKELLQRMESLPGVRSASATSFLPFAGPGAATSFIIEDRPTPSAGEEPNTGVRVIAPNYFQTMGIPLLRGRFFNEQEFTEISGKVIISESLARQHWPDEDPIGKRVTIHMKAENTPSEIIGVVGDIKFTGLDTPAAATVYWPHPELAFSFMSVVARTDSDPLALAAALKHEVQAIDKDQPVADIQTMDALLSASMARSRFATLLLGLFAAIALILAAVGIYGVMSYAVTQRTHEIGIRMALGASAADVLKLIVGRGMALALIGVGIGLGSAFGLTRLLESMLFGVTATDPLIFVAISILLAGVAFLACYIPARRATRVDPMMALRYE